MTVYLVLASLFSVIIAALAALGRKQNIMSATTDTLLAAVSELSVESAAVVKAVAELKAGQTSLADTAAVEKAVADIKAATDALKAAVA